ncbi:HAD family hydrolase [Rhodohalobacter sp. 8-1]|uniref:HAD family hydrolase n=1 Tax=Rhodohalobacter sp. 8-1 TaxID=3131972 RepID=UPI0030EE3DE4
MQQTPILLYDIDGTLLNVHREFILGIIERELSRYNIEKPDANTRSFAGRTDRGIFMELIGDVPNAQELLNTLMDKYAEAMARHLTREFIQLHNGAFESVEEAVSLDIPVGLCTGNVRAVAMEKVKTAGFPDTFKFGGFGEVSEDRNELPGEADREYKSLFSDRPEPGRYVIIGDTPNDIRCAKHFGAKSVAVTTGGFSEKELATHKPDLVISSLHNPKGWLKELGFKNFS